MTTFDYGGAKPEAATQVGAQAASVAAEGPTYEPTSRFTAPPVITLEKTVADDSKRYRVGAIWTWSYKHLMEHEAFAHAIKHLKGEGEDPLHWKRLP